MNLQLFIFLYSFVFCFFLLLFFLFLAILWTKFPFFFSSSSFYRFWPQSVCLVANSWCLASSQTRLGNIYNQKHSSYAQEKSGLLYAVSFLSLHPAKMVSVKFQGDLAAISCMSSEYIETPLSVYLGATGISWWWWWWWVVSGNEWIVVVARADEDDDDDGEGEKGGRERERMREFCAVE